MANGRGGGIEATKGSLTTVLRDNCQALVCERLVVPMIMEDITNADVGKEIAMSAWLVETKTVS